MVISAELFDEISNTESSFFSPPIGTPSEDCSDSPLVIKELQPVCNAKLFILLFLNNSASYTNPVKKYTINTQRKLEANLNDHHALSNLCENIIPDLFCFSRDSEGGFAVFIWDITSSRLSPIHLFCFSFAMSQREFQRNCFPPSVLCEGICTLCQKESSRLSH
ncbi:hypothetical protein WA026_015641 [Henosepilachna vigintioctopunctata]|uniref:Uncharacterized protein n=1 Tax=Henosepilachna vigintioctopunctata TaxID=420089 RepID=A0AAW1VHF0_9CUCU